jgi:DNA-binding Lrp family transcriptional regulator
MAKRSKKQILEDEAKVIKELLKSSGQSIEIIAKRCGFSRQKVWRIINRLEESHIIWGYTTVIDEEKLGRNGFILLLKRSAKPMHADALENVVTGKFADDIANIGVDVVSSMYTHGVYDWIVCFVAKDIKQAKKVTGYFLEEFEGYIADIVLLEELFPLRRSRVLNPEPQKLNEFVA